jgi:hypothetical protein
MKKILTPLMLLFCSNMLAQNVGIGTTDPKARLHVDSTVLFTGNYPLPVSAANPPVSGQGTRMMWYPDKAAFRAGMVSNNDWNKDSIGLYSIAMGLNSKATGYSSVALGNNCVAKDFYSTAIGDSNVAAYYGSVALGTHTYSSAYGSTALGYGSRALLGGTTASGKFATASGEYSTAIGYYPTASGLAAIAMGNTTSASGILSIAIGNVAIASGDYSVSIGSQTQATGYASTAFGDLTTATAAYATALGRITRAYGQSSTSTSEENFARARGSFSTGSFNDSTDTPNPLVAQPGDRIFQLGNGTDHGNRNNAITVLRNARTGIGTTNPLARLHVADSAVVFTGASTLPGSPANPPVSGPGTRMMWYPDKAAFRAGQSYNNEWSKDRIGTHSFAAGFGPEANGASSVAMGYGSTASGFAATAFGNSRAAGDVSTSFGQSNANAPYAFSTGEGTFASSRAAASFGYLTKAKSMYSLVAGQFNDTTTANSLFEVGNGTADNNRRNALTVLTNGNVGIGNKAPLRPLSFTATLGEKILLYPGSTGEVGIGVYGNELRLHADNPGAKVSFGTQTNAGVFTEAGKFEIAGGYALTVFGNIWANGITYNSDARFKKNILPLNNAIQKIQKINGVQYEMMADEYPAKNFIKGTQVGLLAQEVEVVMPQVVSTNEEGYKSVDYAKLIPLLIEGMKEQQKQIEQLRQEVKELKQRK